MRNSLLRWGNWDVVTSSSDNGTNDQTGTRWNSSEVPSAMAGPYANPVPSSQTLPISMYRELEAVVLQDLGCLAADWPGRQRRTIANVGGHVRPIPARQCYLN